MNIAQRYALIGAFFFLATGWVHRSLWWLELRRRYWACRCDADTARPVTRWMPLQLPSQHHPGRPQFTPILCLLVIVFFLLRP